MEEIRQIQFGSPDLSVVPIDLQSDGDSVYTRDNLYENLGTPINMSQSVINLCDLILFCHVGLFCCMFSSSLVRSLLCVCLSLLSYMMLFISKWKKFAFFKKKCARSGVACVCLRVCV